MNYKFVGVEYGRNTWKGKGDQAFVTVVDEEDNFFYYLTPYKKSYTGYNSAWDGKFFNTVEEAFMEAERKLNSFCFK